MHFLKSDVNRLLQNSKGECKTKESKLFFNKRCAFWIGIFSVLILLGIYTLTEELTISIIIIVIGCICLLGYVFLFPNSYRIDEKGIAVYYGFGIKSTAKWNELHTIEDHYCIFQKSTSLVGKGMHTEEQEDNYFNRKVL